MEPEGILIDLEGVLHVGGTPVPGAVDAISYLLDNEYQFRIVSNSTRRSRDAIAHQLGSMGFSIPVSWLFTPPMAAVSYLKKRGENDAHVLVTADVAGEMAREGIHHRTGTARFVVVGDAGELFTYHHLNEAFRELLAGAELIALERDRSWMGSGGMMLSAGPFVAALEYASGKNAVVVGKPSRDFFTQALASMKASPGRSIMIGDDLSTDIGGAAANGIPGVLVQTGKFRQDSLDTAQPKPVMVIPSIAALPACLTSRETWLG